MWVRKIFAISSNLDGAAALGRAHQGLDEKLHLQRFAPADSRFAIFIERIREIGNDAAMRFMREGHGIGTAALRFRALLSQVPPVLVINIERLGSEHDSCALAG